MNPSSPRPGPHRAGGSVGSPRDGQAHGRDPQPGLRVLLLLLLLLEGCCIPAAVPDGRRPAGSLSSAVGYHHFSASLRASNNGNGITCAGGVSVSAGCSARAVGAGTTGAGLLGEGFVLAADGQARCRAVRRWVQVASRNPWSWWLRTQIRDRIGEREDRFFAMVFLGARPATPSRRQRGG